MSKPKPFQVVIGVSEYVVEERDVVFASVLLFDTTHDAHEVVPLSLNKAVMRSIHPTQVTPKPREESLIESAIKVMKIKLLLFLYG